MWAASRSVVTDVFVPTGQGRRLLVFIQGYFICVNCIIPTGYEGV
jgi:hypothetical protein